MNGKLCKIFFMILVACVAALPNETFAAAEKFEAVGVYVVGNGEDESPKIAKARAKKDAVRVALEKAGVYVESFSEMKNFRLTKDEIKIIAGEIVAVESESYSVEILPNEVIRYTAVIQAVVDTDIIETKIKQLERSGENFSSEAERLRKENERLKADFAKATTDSERKKIKAASIQNDKLFQANQYLDKSIEMLNAGEWLSSLDESKKALNTDPTNADVLANRARAHVNANQLETAKDEITKAIELNPKNNDYKVILGNVYFAAGEYDNAMDYYNEALTKDKNNAEAYFQRGMIYFDRDKNFDGAIAEFDTAIAKNPNYAEAYYKRGMAYFHKNVNNPDMLNRNAPPNNLIGAFDNFSKYLTFDNAPKKADAVQRRTQIANLLSSYYRLNGDNETANKYFNLVNDKDDAATHIKRGKEYLNPGMNAMSESDATRNKRFDDAIAEFTKAIELEPNNAEAYCARAEAYVDKGWNNGEFMPTANETPLFDLARKDANKCLQLNPNHPGAKIVLERINSVSTVKNDYADAKNREQSMRANLDEAMRRPKETMERIKKRK